MNIRFIADFTIPENDFYEYESEEALFEEIWEYACEYGLRKYKYNCETEVLR